MNPFAAHTYVVEKLTAAGVGRVYVDMPDTLTLPAVIVYPSTPWVEPHTMGQWRINLRVQCVGGLNGGNTQAHKDVSGLVGKVLSVFPIQGSIDAPSQDKAGTVDVLQAWVPVSVQLTDDEE